MESGQVEFPDTDQSVVKRIAAFSNLCNKIQETSEFANSETKPSDVTGQQLLERLADTVDAFVWSVELPSRQVTMTGKGFERLTGGDLSTGDDRFARWSQLVHPDDKNIIGTAWESTFAGNSFDVEYRVVGIDGRTRWISSRGVPRLNWQGVVDQINGVAVDITDRKQSEEDSRTKFLALKAAKEAGRVGRSSETSISGNYVS